MLEHCVGGRGMEDKGDAEVLQGGDIGVDRAVSKVVEVGDKVEDKYVWC